MLRPARLMLRLLTLLLLVQWSFGPTHGLGGSPAAPTTTILSPNGARMGLSGVHHDTPPHGPAEEAAAAAGGGGSAFLTEHGAGHSPHEMPGHDGPGHGGKKHDGDRQKPGHPMSASCQFCLNPAGGDLPGAPVLPVPRAVVFRATVLLDSPLSVPQPPKTYSSRAPPSLFQV